MRRGPRVARWRAAAVAAVMLGAAGLAAVTAAMSPSVAVPAESGRAAQRVHPPEPVLVIGDSAIAAIRWVPGAVTAVLATEHVTLDLESCRRLVAPSCRGREGRVPATVLETIRATRGTYHTVVVATGYNDGATDFESWLRTIVAQARSQGIERIVWMTLRDEVTYVSPGELGLHETFAENNATLRRLVASGAFPDVIIADWDTYTAGRSDWFAVDGVHYRTVAAWGAADYLTRKLAFLDGRRCPMPVTPGGVRPDPCPDPDATGLVASIETLYSIGTPGIVCYEVGESHEVVCTTDPRLTERAGDGPR